MPFTHSAPPRLVEVLEEQILADPGLPVAKPTTSYWQLPPHGRLANIQSKSLTERTDYVVIGSGITGCSVAKHILDREQGTAATVTVLEARAITSGATGRNGGGLASSVPYIFSWLVETHGEEHAKSIARFTYGTLEKIHELANSTSELKDTSEVRRGRDIMSFRDVETFEYMLGSFRHMMRLVPEIKVDLEVFDAETFQKDFGVNTLGGGLRHNCGAFWPYRFVTTYWEQLLDQHSSQLKIETHTTVSDITCPGDDSEYPYVVVTNRGNVRTKRIVHGTNGYTGHLLPGLRGKIFPVKGFLSSQKAGSNFQDPGTDRTWSFFGDKKLNFETWLQESGVYYGQRTQKTGTIMWGGDKVPIDQLIDADDSIIPQASYEDLASVLPKLFRNKWPDGEKPVVEGLWAGIQGYTADHLPIVGRILADIAPRGEHDPHEEYVAAGFNGAGMCNCWSSGEALVKIMFGEDTSDFLPEPYRLTEERLARPTCSVKNAVESFVGLNH